MMLSDVDIEESILSGRLVIDPYDPTALQPASLDMRLGEGFSVPGTGSEGRLWLPTGRLVLGHTLEYVKIPDDLAARVEGKSTWGRRGLQVHLTAGFIDPGFQGQITLELLNVSGHTLFLKPGSPIAQLSFHRLTSSARRPYGSPELGSHYQDQRGATPPYE